MALSLSPATGEPIGNEIAWLEGAEGYRSGVETAKETGRPVLLYFYTDWCPYCRQLDRDLLSTVEVQLEIGEMIAVRVNPETGTDEQALASQFGIPGYPALFVRSDGELRSIRRTVGGQGGVRLKTPEEFAATLAAAR